MQPRPTDPSRPTPGERVLVFDTTLRDGEQSPGSSLSCEQKVRLAETLAGLGVDVIEAGFPAASPGDHAAVSKIAETVGKHPTGPVICALARATRRDIDLAHEATRAARQPRIHTFIATSPIHRVHKLHMSSDEVLARVERAVSHARDRTADVEFSAEDAYRTEPQFLAEVLEAAWEAGARTLNVPDTVGYALPEAFGERIEWLRSAFPGAQEALFSVHCHDDLGMATANAIAGLRAGARQVEVTINGIGERAGNSSLEELVMTLYVHRDALRLCTGIDTTRLAMASKEVSRCTGIDVQPNKAIVGVNAFAHEAGIHQDGMLKHQETYEIMRPELVGVSSSRLVLGKHSGRHAFKARLAQLGFTLEADAIDPLFAQFKRLADRKTRITDADLAALARGAQDAPAQFAIRDLQVVCGSRGMPASSVRVACPDGTELTEISMGTGPVDATFQAIDRIVGRPCELLEYRVRAVTEGIDAVGEVYVELRSETEAGEELIVCSSNADTDVIVASAQAYLGALNQLVLRGARQLIAATARVG